MAWEQWILPAVLLGGVGGLYYLMAKKGIGCCGSMMSSGCGAGTEDEARESPRSRAEAHESREPVDVASPAPVERGRTRSGALVGHIDGDPGER